MVVKPAICRSYDHPCLPRNFSLEPEISHLYPLPMPDSVPEETATTTVQHVVGDVEIQIRGRDEDPIFRSLSAELSGVIDAFCSTRPAQLP